MLVGSKEKKQHRYRKNPRSYELYKQENHEQNAKRPKQRWTGGESIAEGGHWTREAV